MTQSNKERLAKFICFVACILSLVFMYKCENKELIPENKVSILIDKNNALDSVKNVYLAKLDSLAKVKNVVLTKYITIKKNSRDTIILNIHDSVIVMREVDRIISNCDSVIKIDSMQISNYSLLSSNLKRHILNDSCIISFQKKEIKKQKRQKLLIGAIGIFVVGALIVK